jgi:hypothetical protein
VIQIVATLEGFALPVLFPVISLISIVTLTKLTRKIAPPGIPNFVTTSIVVGVTTLICGLVFFLFLEFAPGIDL